MIDESEASKKLISPDEIVSYQPMPNVFLDWLKKLFSFGAETAYLVVLLLLAITAHWYEKVETTSYKAIISLFVVMILVMTAIKDPEGRG